ncbi:MAG: hypothetical protein LBC57_01180 [Treponema sp.]|jgi:hypothetical protein|nr:hypothetical protein [Treponema sp.]
MKPKLLFTLLVFLPLCVSGRDLPLSRIADDSALRLEIRDTWLLEVPGRVLAKGSERRNLAGGGRVEIRTESKGEEFNIVIARESGAGRTMGSFPGYAQGSWVLSRRRDTGEALRIRVFLRSDAFTYVQFRPWTGDKCLMDLVLYDAYVLRSQPIPVPFERLYEISVEEALRLAGDRFPGRYFEAEPSNYREIREFIKIVRSQLPALNFLDDGAIDENGNYVFIKDGRPQEGEKGLNCSGFAKWIIDLLLMPYTGAPLPIAPLKAPAGNRGSSFTKAFEELRDPFFGLDWTRNLALSAAAVLRSPGAAVIEEVEVRESSFSDLILRDPKTSSPAGERSYPGYIENAGFGMEGLQPLLYTLAINEPGTVYLASINTEMSGPPRKNQYLSLRLRQHFHIAVLLPYFNEEGEFRIAVFESAAETAFSRFRSRYPGHYVNLVRIPLSASLMPLR